jgi:hypothetical protein
MNDGVISDAEGAIIAGEGNPEGAFLIPQTVFVGDEGRLVVPLPPNLPLSVFRSVPAGTKGPVVITSGLPSDDDIIVKRIEIDRETGRLSLDFVAFRPGVVDVPPVPVAGVPRLTVSIASILERSGYSTVLSPPQKSLAAPGTFALIIGMATVLFVLAALAGIAVSYGPRHFKRLLEKIRVWFLRRKAKRAIRAVENALIGGRIGTKEGVAVVNKAFRGFLSAFYRKNYASYSAEDFLTDKTFPDEAVYRIFSGYDRLRFSQASIEWEAVSAVAQETMSYIDGCVV